MRIAHVVTLIDPEASFGGPLRVAINQVNQLKIQGIDAEIVAAAKGYPVLPQSIDGAPVRLFRAKALLPDAGFSGIFSLALIFFMLRNIRKYDVVHVHLTRDLVTLPVARLALLLRVPLVVQTHGMIDQTEKSLAKPLDRLITFPVLWGAQAILHLTELEKQQLLELLPLPELNLIRLANGVPAAASSEKSSSSREPEVLFLARLHARKRPVMFTEVAISLLEGGCDARFTLVGPDGGEAEAVRKLLSKYSDNRLQYEGSLPLKEAPARIGSATVYVLPSIHEPFPMSVLEAMAAGKPVIVTDTCGLAQHIRASDSGIVVHDDAQSLKAAIQELIDDPDRCAEMGQNGYELSKSEFSMANVGLKLNSVYQTARGL